jgi:hypothetical protein
VSYSGLRKQNSARFLLLLIAILVNAFLFPVLVCGQANDLWLGGTGNWSDAGKWSAGVPTRFTDVFIDNGNGTASAVTVDVGGSVRNLTIDSDDSLIIPNGNTLLVYGNITNNGQINVNSGTLFIPAKFAVTLSGSGTVTLNGGSIRGGIFESFGNDSAIQGSGRIVPYALTNGKNGTINANQSGGQLLVGAASPFTNSGLMEAVNGGVLNLTSTVSNSGTIWAVEHFPCISGGGHVLVTGTITNKGRFIVSPGTGFSVTGTLTNFSGTALTGGMYSVYSGRYLSLPCRGTFSFHGANVVTNAAHISLSGPYSAFSGLGSLASTTVNGSLALQGTNLTTPGSYTNAGKLTVGNLTSFKINGSYAETAGMTTVNGTLAAPSGTTIQAGSVFGTGAIASTVVSSGAVTAGVSAASPGRLSLSTYTANANSSTNIGIRSGTQYGQLAVVNGAALNGTLNITLINGFVPAISSTFTILTGSAISGKFSTVNGLSINSGEHFTISYNPTNVILTVVSGTY